MLDLRTASPDEIASWDDLITQFRGSRVTHSTHWIRSLENYFGGEPLYLVYERSSRIVGLLPGLIVEKGPLRLFGSPLPGWQTVSMGPVFDPKLATTAELIDPLPRFLEQNYGVHHIEIMSDRLDPAAMESNHFTGRVEYTFKAPLHPSDPAKTFAGLKGSARRNIRRGERLGLSVRFTDDPDFADEVFEQAAEVYLRGGNVIPFTKERIREFMENMKRGGDLVAAGVYLPDSDICIASSLFTISNNELVLWMWAHRHEYRWHCPTEMMTWTVMKHAMEQGCDRFDLMGRGDFKTKFGASLASDKIRWVRSRYRLLSVARDAAERLYRLQQSLRGRYARRQLAAAAK